MSSYLGRQAVYGEEQTWVKQLMAGATEDQVQSEILASAEFANRANALVGNANSDVNFVESLYQVLLKRTPSSAEVNGWLSDVRTEGRAAVTQAFLESVEHRTIVVSDDFANLLQRPGTAAEIASWVNGPHDLQAIRYLIEASAEFYGDA